MLKSFHSIGAGGGVSSAHMQMLKLVDDFLKVPQQQ